MRKRRLVRRIVTFPCIATITTEVKPKCTDTILATYAFELLVGPAPRVGLLVLFSLHDSFCPVSKVFRKSSD
jgi:hypothetical protein